MPRAVRLDAVRDFNRRGPPGGAAPRHPDPDVRVALARAAEPGRDEAVARLDNRRRVRRGKRRALEDEFRLHDERQQDLR